MKRRLFAGSSVLMLGFLLIGCGGSPSEPSPPPPPPPPTGTWIDNEPTTIGTLAGNPNPGNSFPFGAMPPNFPATTYQQVYASGQFGTSPIRLTRLDFFAVATGSSPRRDVVSANYEFSLSTTSRSVDGLDTANLGTNVGSDVRVVLATALGAGAIVDNVMNITFSTPFNYSPTGGNLLLQILRSSPGANVSVGLVSHVPNDGFPRGLSSRASNFGNGHAGFYLVTRFHHQRCQCPTAEPCTCPN